MSSFTLTRIAKEDLKSIAIFTQKRWGKNQRIIYIKQIDDTFHLLAEQPNTGTACDYIKPGYRKFPSSNHIIYYREITANNIEVVRILHKRMDAHSNITA
ncbi:type II toxin-antitoxin system RelE/ParE family toxin [Litoribacillus peritrichatus]|uniref:Toxin n=1 Tax=Litoribacillus peritrichatus TaxID=718191 RepID=A0ABP7M7I5_9GAMM